MSDLEIFSKQPVNRFDVVADSHHRETGTVVGFGCVAWRRGPSISEELRRYQEETGGVESAAPSNEPFIAVEICHVVRRQQHDIIFGGIQLAVCSVYYSRLRQSNSALGPEIGDREFVLLGALLLCRCVLAR